MLLRLERPPSAEALGQAEDIVWPHVPCWFYYIVTIHREDGRGRGTFCAECVEMLGGDGQEKRLSMYASLMGVDDRRKHVVYILTRLSIILFVGHQIILRIIEHINGIDHLKVESARTSR